MTGEMPDERSRRSKGRSRLIPVTIILIIISAYAYTVLTPPPVQEGPIATTFTPIPTPPITTTTATVVKPIILYVNQGNGFVEPDRFGDLLAFAKRFGFNSVMFQVYREGSFLYSLDDMNKFHDKSTRAGMRFYPSLFISKDGEKIDLISQLSAEGMNLDMPSLSLDWQSRYIAAVRQLFKGPVSVTTSNAQYPLRPDLLILETYGRENLRYVRPGVVGSVGVWLTTDKGDYLDQVSYVLAHSDGVMVFDYAGLLRKGW